MLDLWVQVVCRLIVVQVDLANNKTNYCTVLMREREDVTLCVCVCVCMHACIHTYMGESER